MKNKFKKKIMQILIATFMAIIICSNTISSDSIPSEGYWQFTTDEDWYAEGNAIFYNIQENQAYLTLTSETTTHNFLWIANSGESTISKIDTDLNKEIARYFTGPANSIDSEYRNQEGPFPIYLLNSPDGRQYPSRTAVDMDGNVWVGNRKADKTVVKIAGDISNCVDRNGDGDIQTSGISYGSVMIYPWDYNADGFPDDECIILVTEQLSPNDIGPRAVVIDHQNYVWIGLDHDKKYVKLDPHTGEVIDTVYLGEKPYGAVIDKDGFLWSSNRDSSSISKFDTNLEDPVVTTYDTFSPYGIAVDNKGNVWVGIYDGTTMLRKFDIEREEYVSNYGLIVSPDIHLWHGKGVAVDNDGNIWVVDAVYSNIAKFNPNVDPATDADKGLLCYNNQPNSFTFIGIVLDSKGKMWAIGYGNNKAMKLNSECEIIEEVEVGDNPYTYSDAAGSSLHQSIDAGYWKITLQNTMQSCESFSSKISWTEENNKGDNIIVQAKTPQQESFTEIDNGGRFDYNYETDGFFTIQVNIKANADSTSTSPRINSLTIDDTQCIIECVPTPGQETQETNCGDGIDNDCDGFFNCDDPDCSEDPACASAVCDPGPPPETQDCSTGESGICSEGTQTCQLDRTWGDCVRNNNPTIEVCDDVGELDEDCDGDSNCNDIDDCADDPICISACVITEDPEETCNDGVDNNCEDGIDCADPDCTLDPACDCLQLTCDNDGGWCQYGNEDTECVCMEPECKIPTVCGEYTTPLSCENDGHTANLAATDPQRSPSCSNYRCEWEDYDNSDTGDDECVFKETCPNPDGEGSCTCIKSYRIEHPYMGRDDLKRIIWDFLVEWTGEIPEGCEDNDCQFLTDIGCTDGETVIKISSIRLKFFTLKNFIVALAVIVLVYFLSNKLKKKPIKKKKAKKKK